MRNKPSTSFAPALASALAAPLAPLADRDNPKRRSLLGFKLPYLPLGLLRVYKVNYVLIESLASAVFGPQGQIAYLHIKDVWQRSKKAKTAEAAVDQQTFRTDQRILYNIDYGSRNGTKLDLFKAAFVREAENAYPTDSEGRRPVIIFIYGGAWCFGDKKMYTHLGKNLSKLGYVVVVPNYTLWPKGTAEDMMHDIQKAVEWTTENIRDYGGDDKNINIFAHSAGAHLSALLMIKNAMMLSEACLQERMRSNHPDYINPHSEVEKKSSSCPLSLVNSMIM
eukprot:jgi/Hompol1/19/HPOL_002708-RA